MVKVSHRHLFLMLTLPGLWLMAAFLIGGGAEVLSGGFPNVAAAAQPADRSEGGCTSQHQEPVFDSSVVVNRGEVICSNLIAFGGNMLIHGEVRGDVVAFGGNIVIDGIVNGTVRAYMGNIAMLHTAQIDGDIHLCGGQKIKDSASTLQGAIYDCPRSVALLVAGNGDPTFRFWSLLTWVILGLVLTALLPEHVMLVRTTFVNKKRRSLLLGVLSVLLAPAVLAVSIALIISIPLAIIVTVGLIAAWALGTIAVGWWLGDSIVQRVLPQHNTRSLQVVVGVAILVLAGSLPYIGWAISIGAGLVGLGAVFLSRFGTRLYSQPKQPLLPL